MADSSAVAIAEGRTTASSMAALARWGDRHGLRWLLLVSDPFHSLRLMIEAHCTGLAGYASPTRTSPISARRSREIPDLLGEGLKLPLTWLRGLIF